MPSDLFAYGREAPNCFDLRRYLATIILATAQIEIILNKDSRMRRVDDGWRTLKMKLLGDAAGKGLPVHCLLAEGESLRAASIGFVDLRNRLAHGNLAGIIGFELNGTPDYSAEAREDCTGANEESDGLCYGVVQHLAGCAGTADCASSVA
jgi:hypothetical protein